MTGFATRSIPRCGRTEPLERRKHRVTIACGAIAAFTFVFSLFGPALADWFAGLDAVTCDDQLGATAPSWRHWFGTDPRGRDMLVRTMMGGRVAIGMAVAAALLSMSIGGLWGAIMGALGGRVDRCMMRGIDLVRSIPIILVVIAISALLERRSGLVLLALIGASSTLTIARLARGRVRSLGDKRTFEPLRMSCAFTWGRLARLIAPKALGGPLVYAIASVPGIMLTEAFLSFLGLGVVAPTTSWGTLMAEGARVVAVFPWLLIGPALIMGATVIALELLGDRLRDVWLRQRHPAGPRSAQAARP